MRNLMTPLSLALSVLLAGSVWAEENASGSEERAERRAEMRQKILAEFDADGDGELNDEERSAAREEMRSRRGERGKAGKGKGKKKGEKGAKGDRRPRPESRRRGGPGGPPDPEKLFDRFDANGDGQLSRAEFMKLHEEMRPPRPPRTADRRGGPRPDGPRPDGPPPEGRRRFERDKPLQNPSDRPEPPQARRRLMDEDVVPASRKRGGRGPKGGPGARGPEGRRPNPEAIFERFDENGDDQLSRAEFMKLADRMREMHERMRGGEGRGPGMRDGRGPRRGPPGEGGSRGRRRPPRPDGDAGVEMSVPDEDNTV